MKAGLRHLQGFVAVAEERHFGRAARRLGIAQPSLSRQVYALERELGAELLDRASRPLRLTAAGDDLLQEARSILDRAERAVERTRRTARGERGRLSVATLPWAYSSTLPCILRAFREYAPRVRLELSTRTGDELADALAKDWVDVGLERVPVLTSALQAELLHEEKLVVIVGQEHRLADRAVISMNDVAGESFVSIARECVPGFANLAEQFARQCVQPAVVHEAPDPQAQLALVAAGVGIGLHLAPAATRRQCGVVFIALEENVPVPPLALVWRRDDDRELLRLFLDTARQVARSLDGIPPEAAESAPQLRDWYTEAHHALGPGG